VKTRAQLVIGKNQIPFYNLLFSIVKNEGYNWFSFSSPFRLYRGIMAPILIEAPKRAVKFASNEQYIKMLENFKGSKNLSNSYHIFSGVLAGVTEAFIVVSMELVKVRMQSSQNV
jgi:solute carrier family 25 (mitochondrial 2-oxodicarboxylate transporter), member 21